MFVAGMSFYYLYGVTYSHHLLHVRVPKHPAESERWLHNNVVLLRVQKLKMLS
jgi:hypothetical protein